MYNSKRIYEAEIVSRFLADHSRSRIGSGGGVEFQHVAVFDKINLIEYKKVRRSPKGTSTPFFLLLLPLYRSLVEANTENPSQCTSSQRNLQPTVAI